MSRLLGGMSPQRFLAEYWQKKPLLIEAAWPQVADSLGSEDLQELAGEDGIEARLILEHGATPWELRHGPFDAAVFAALPASHWTLLVQAVDHYDLQWRSLLDELSFLPNWRIDDIMISYAPEDGSVGPHDDRYDVFLLQLHGHRHWRIGPVVSATHPRLAHPRLRLLQDMPVEFEATLAPGDLLYLPPGVAHHGVASDACLTLSIGFRAPTLAHLLERIVDASLEADPGLRLFQDGQRQPCTHPGALATEDIEALRRQVLALLEDDERWRQVLGASLSEAKYEDYQPHGEVISRRALRAHLQGGGALLRDPASRFIYTESTSGQTLAWVNGEARTDMPMHLLTRIADARRLTSRDLPPLQASEEAALCAWIEEGLLLLEE